MLIIFFVFLEQQPIPDQNPEAIFANNELSLANIEIYGFDYDYTLATYTPELHKLIFTLGRDALVNKLRVRLLQI